MDSLYPRKLCENNWNAVCGSSLSSLTEIHNINPSHYFYFWVNLLKNRIWVYTAVFYRPGFMYRLLKWWCPSVFHMKLDGHKKLSGAVKGQCVQLWNRCTARGWSVCGLHKPLLSAWSSCSNTLWLPASDMFPPGIQRRHGETLSIPSLLPVSHSNANRILWTKY